LRSGFLILRKEKRKRRFKETKDFAPKKEKGGNYKSLFQQEKKGKRFRGREKGDISGHGGGGDYVPLRSIEKKEEGGSKRTGGGNSPEKEKRGKGLKENEIFFNTI